MPNNLSRTVGIRVLVIAAVVLVAAACSASDDGASNGTDSTSITASAAAGEAVTTDPPTTPPQDANDSGPGDYSVLMFANTDELTARGALESMEAAGFTGFMVEGSAEEGFDLYKPGLTNQEALDLLTDILLAPDVNGGLIFKTANLP